MSSAYPSTPVLPNGYHGSTTFNSQIKSYDHLAQRVRRSLGEPLIKIEISSEQIYEMIDIAIEYFTKFAGLEEEYLIFRSDLYKTGIGLEIGKLMNITPDMYNSNTSNPSLSACYDYDLDDYRRVVDVFSFAEGNNTGVNTLFTIENTIAQQAYFGQLLGNVGYDLVTWQALKTWLDTRDKLLALTPYLRFDPDTQILKIIPEPSQQSSSPYFGLIGCKMQKPLKFLVNQLWVYRYTLALTKIAIGHVRGKYSGTNLFGGQTVNYQDLMSQGIAEKAALEDEITKDTIDRDPIKFFIG
ncbi:MAG: hypothetical protein EBU90_00375 [Proteobacteria bacterium]|nr:hypothetical protein [Pseudomonadota bacterium]NBP12886.1 hypothetical protein [bacterium]